MNPNRRRPSGRLDISGRPGSESRLRTHERIPAQSGQYVMRYALIREILLRYLSPILVDTVLDRAMRARNVLPSMLSASALGEMTSDIMVGLRLFVPEERLPQLMLELADVLEGEDT
jgi:hypothetical protein